MKMIMQLYKPDLKNRRLKTMCSGVQGIGDKADKKGLWKEIIIARYGIEGP